ncbi:hypothetical protein FJ364_05925 [Candidatus Dependentiae bacterium]|nr:hypothetical protein [Candidatus Dependentiae bacterium]
MAKIRGKQVYLHPLPVFAEMWALERELDSLSQKGFPVSKQLGRIRSIIQRYPDEVVREQKTLKRWINPAPNHILKNKKNGF